MHNLLEAEQQWYKPKKTILNNLLISATVSKKNLKDGLESLFGGPAIAEPSLPENSPLLERTERDNKPSAKKSVKVRAKRSKSSKSFTSDLDSLFESVISENIRDKQYEETPSNNPSSKRALKRSPVVGLDALLQSTTDSNFDYTSTKKRVTFIFEKKKLDKLKRIAKLQKAYLKDIIGKIVGEHIAKYDDEGHPKR